MSADAREILDALQAAIDGRDPDILNALFEERSVLIGTAGDGRSPDARRRYLDAVAQGEPFRWDWQEIVSFHESDDTLGFAAFGALVVSGDEGEQCYPMRATVLSVQTPDGWRLRHFNGSVPPIS
ncbi:MAG: nuclear transport factor 2 family protein [Gaiellaceae bacterium]